MLCCGVACVRWAAGFIWLILLLMLSQGSVLAHMTGWHVSATPTLWDKLFNRALVKEWHASQATAKAGKDKDGKDGASKAAGSDGSQATGKGAGTDVGMASKAAAAVPGGARAQAESTEAARACADAAALAGAATHGMALLPGHVPASPKPGPPSASPGSGQTSIPLRTMPIL